MKFDIFWSQNWYMISKMRNLRLLEKSAPFLFTCSCSSCTLTSFTFTHVILIPRWYSLQRLAKLFKLVSAQWLTFPKTENESPFNNFQCVCVNASSCYGFFPCVQHDHHEKNQSNMFLLFSPLKQTISNNINYANDRQDIHKLKYLNLTCNQGGKDEINPHF